MTAIQYTAIFIGLTAGGILCFAWMIWTARPATPDDLPAEVPETNGEVDLVRVTPNVLEERAANDHIERHVKTRPAYIATMNGVVVPKSDDCPF